MFINIPELNTVRELVAYMTERETKWSKWYKTTNN